MERTLKRLCWRCAEKLRNGGVGCTLLDVGGSSGECPDCGTHRVCESYEITYGRTVCRACDGRKESNDAD